MNTNQDPTCAEVRDLVPVLDDGSLDGQRREALVEHVLHCEACRETLAGHRRAMSALRGSVPEAMPQATIDGILAAVDQAARPLVESQVDAPSDAGEVERLAYRRALFAAAQLRAPSRARRVAVFGLASLLGAAAALLLVWSFFGGRLDNEPRVEQPTASIPEPVDPIPAPVSEPFVRPVLRIETGPLAQLGGQIWEDLRQGAHSAVSVLRPLAQLELAVAPPVPVQPVPVQPAPVRPTPAPPTPSRQAPVHSPPVGRVVSGMAVVVRDGPELELHVAGSVREVVPTLLNLLDREEEDLVALASARLEELRGQVRALPGVGLAVEQQLASAGSTRSWWSQVFRGERTPDRQPTLSETWMHWWSVAEPLIPEDPAEGSA